jgi:hypothetical protein
MNDKLKNKLINYFKNNLTGNAKDLPQDIKDYFTNSLGLKFNILDNILNVKKGTILYDIAFGNTYEVNDILIGKNITYINTINNEVLEIFTIKNKSYRKLKIKDNENI